MSRVCILWVLCVLLLALKSGEGADDAWPPDKLFSSGQPWIQGTPPAARPAAPPQRIASLETEPRVNSLTRPPGPAPFESETGTEMRTEPEGDEAEEDHIETDRDSFTPATTTVGRGRIVVESAYTFIDNRDVAETHSYPELLLRYGLSERLEFRVGWNYEVGGAGNDTAGQGVASAEGGGRRLLRRRRRIAGVPPEEPELERESTISYGAKLALTEQEGFIPESAVILQGFTPTDGPSSTTTVVGGYVAGWTVLGNCKLDTAIRYGTGEEEGDRFGNLAPSVVLRVPVGERWNAHAEWFGVFCDHRETDAEVQYFSPGLHYLVTPDFEVGFRVGWGLTDQSAKFFCNSGVGVRF